MKKILTLALIAALGVAGASARSYKRGVSENQFSLLGQMKPLEPGVSWYYTWGNTPPSGYQDQLVGYEGYDFIPMCWNAGYNADAIREYCRTHPKCKYILGFNEPNFKAQANMTPQEAAAKWPDVVALAREFNLKIVAPAMNYSPDAPYQQPTSWFDEFVNLVGKDAFDFVAIHNYGGFGVMQTLGTQFWERYGKPVWVTEFCYWPNEGKATRVEPEVQISSMVQCVEWLEKTPWIYRYAWFKAIGRHENTATLSSPCYALIKQESGTGDKELSPQGKVYVYMSTFDTAKWHPVSTAIPATEYIASNGINLHEGNNPANPLPIEVSQFNAGAYLDYQFNVPAAGTYNLVLSVTGKGEPTRYDPSVGISLVQGDNVTELCAPAIFSLPGNETEYINRSFEVNLPAGQVTLRVLDGRPGRPSGIRISTVGLWDKAGVEDVTVDAADNADAVVYTLNGQVAARPLAPGIYIRAGKKFIVR